MIMIVKGVGMLSGDNGLRSPRVKVKAAGLSRIQPGVGPKYIEPGLLYNRQIRILVAIRYPGLAGNGVDKNMGALLSIPIITH